MTDKDKALVALDGVIHPETGQGLASAGFVASVEVTEGGVDVVLKFRRSRDPFAGRLARQATEALREAFAGAEVRVNVDSVEPAPAPVVSRRLPGVERVVAVASGKGGVGKSTVAAGLAVALAGEGYRVGVLDADIYGPSQPTLFGVEGYMPAAEGEGADAAIVPADSGGVKIMSIGFFIAPDDALIWRGPMAVNALRQLIRQTEWGELDFLIVDLPPGTGDVHLSVVHDLELDGAIVVSTPGRLAVADVRRGVEMLRTEGIDVPVLGVVENMAWFSPAELPDNKYFIFGQGGAREFADQAGIDFLGSIPLVVAAGEGAETAEAVKGGAPDSPVAQYHRAIARKVVEKLMERC